jgi:Mce-associated membrane protein
VTEDVRDIDSAAPDAAADAPADADDADDSLTEEPLSEEAEPDEDEAEAPAETERPRRLPTRIPRAVAVILVVLLLISGGAATWLYFKQYRPVQQTSDDVSLTVARAASDGTTALLSYSSDSLDKDFAAAKSHLAGDFLSYFDQFSQQSVAPVARQKSLKTTAKVTGAAVTELHPDWAVALVFVDQVTTTKDSPQPSVAVSSVLVRMDRVGGDWLITKFTPIST